MQTLAPFGFIPIGHSSGGALPMMKYGNVVSPTTHPFYQGQPVLIDGSGNIQPAVTYGAPNTVAPVQAIFYGAELSVPGGYIKETPFIPQGQVIFNSSISGTNNGNTYNTFVKPYLYQDSNILFKVQFNGTITKAAMGQSFDIDPTTIDAGNISGFSSVALVPTPVSSLAGNFIVVDLFEDVNNQWSDPYPVVVVTFNKNRY